MIDKQKLFNQEDLEIYLKYKLNINLVILSFFLFLHCFWGFVTYIIFAILLLFIIFDSLKNSITYLVFYYPFCLIAISINAILFAVLIGAFLIKYIIKTYIIEKSKIDFVLILLIGIFFVYCLLPFGPYSANTLTRIVCFVGIFLALSIAIKKPDDVRFKFNVKMLGLAILVASVFSLTQYFSPFLADYFAMQPGQQGRFRALFLEPNMLAMFCEVIAAILVYYILSDKAGKTEIALFVLLTIVGVLTLSKTFLILMLVEYIAIFIYALSKNWKKTLIVVGILALCALIAGLIGHKFIEDYIKRFLDGHTHFESFVDFLNVITTYRYMLWDAYSTKISTEPLILFFGSGIGIGPLPTIGPESETRWLSAHNLFISMVYQLGLVGSILFAVILVYLIAKLIKKTQVKINKAIAVPIIVCFLLFFVEDIIFYMN